MYVTRCDHFVTSPGVPRARGLSRGDPTGDPDPGCQWLCSENRGHRGFGLSVLLNFRTIVYGKVQQRERESTLSATLAALAKVVKIFYINPSVAACLHFQAKLRCDTCPSIS